MGKNDWPLSPLYQPSPQALKPRDLKRFRRHSLPSLERVMLTQIDRFELERRQRRELFLLDCACVVMFAIIAVCLIGVVMGA